MVEEEEVAGLELLGVVPVSELAGHFHVTVELNVHLAVAVGVDAAVGAHDEKNGCYGLNG